MTRHRLDTLSLVSGLLFTAIGVAALFDAIDLDVFTTDWVWPAVLIGAGVAVLLTLTSREGPSRDDRDTRPLADEDPALGADARDR